MTEPANGVYARLAAAEEDLRDMRAELRAANFNVLADRLERVTSDLAEFRKQVRGEMADVKRAQTLVLRTLVSLLATVAVGLLLQLSPTL